MLLLFHHTYLNQKSSKCPIRSVAYMRLQKIDLQQGFDSTIETRTVFHYLIDSERDCEDCDILAQLKALRLFLRLRPVFVFLIITKFSLLLLYFRWLV